ncbi:MAG: ferritin-like domain-containing protein [Gammaproteobacteria bacterium]|nr:ferritin-like domain-containing protein [Gammaproteobacteria bacterium]MBU1725336.1 ferritin-like domain-containing protein [Gammaproteobacteria bacterium]MBU2004345.1 ferritin-like domain-containing protein [Gammaproteobacteria bacterium]
MQNLYVAAYACLMQTDLEQKLACAQQLYADWQAGILLRETPPDCPVMTVLVPGRPARPELVHPKQVKQRKLTTPEGRRALLHAIAHIEFNAINLGLDAVYRFRDMPNDYYGDWLQVAAEEAYHFSLLRARMQDFACAYGDLPAHNGLWEQACKTDYDVMVRMALVPRVLEARGLDVTPGMMARLREVGDETTIGILEIILRDEIGHVRIGSRWFRYCCEQRGLEAEATFRQLLRDVMQAPLRGPFYTEARLQAGFTAEELEQLLAMEQQWMAEIAQ